MNIFAHEVEFGEVFGRIRVKLLIQFIQMSNFLGKLFVGIILGP